MKKMWTRKFGLAISLGLLSGPAFCQMADTYRAAAQDFNNSAAQCQNPAGASCLRQNAQYYNCIANQLGGGGSCGAQPSCSTSCSTGGVSSAGGIAGSSISGAGLPKAAQIAQGLGTIAQLLIGRMAAREAAAEQNRQTQADAAQDNGVADAAEAVVAADAQRQKLNSDAASILQQSNDLAGSLNGLSAAPEAPAATSTISSLLDSSAPSPNSAPAITAILDSAGVQMGASVNPPPPASGNAATAVTAILDSAGAPMGAYVNPPTSTPGATVTTTATISSLLDESNPPNAPSTIATAALAGPTSSTATSESVTSGPSNADPSSTITGSSPDPTASASNGSSSDTTNLASTASTQLAGYVPNTSSIATVVANNTDSASSDSGLLAKAGLVTDSPSPSGAQAGAYEVNTNVNTTNSIPTVAATLAPPSTQPTGSTAIASNSLGSSNTMLPSGFSPQQAEQREAKSGELLSEDQKLVIANTALNEVDASAMELSTAAAEIKPLGLKQAGINYVGAVGAEVEVTGSSALTETGGVVLGLEAGLLDPTVAPGVVQIYKGTKNPTNSWNTGSAEQICEMFPDQDGCQPVKPPPIKASPPTTVSKVVTP